MKSKTQIAFITSFVGPRLNGTQKAKILRDIFKRDFVGPLPQESFSHWRKVKAFRQEFVGPRIPPGTKAYGKFHGAKHYRLNKGVRRADAKVRKEKRRQRIPSWFGEFDRFVFEEAYSLLPVRKEATGVEWHVDHMLPLRSRRVSGLHVGLNAAVIPAELNLKKGNRLILTETGDWLRL